MATAFTQLGAVSARIAVLTGAVQALVQILAAITLYAVWKRHKA